MKALPGLIELLTRDDVQQAVDHEEKAKQTPWLRAGNSGVVLDNGVIGIQCPRKALLRKLAIELPVPLNRRPMFDHGIAMEDVIKAKLIRQLGDTCEITGDDVNATEWSNYFDTKVTGSPDLLIKSKHTGELLAGIELKTCCSVWTAKSVMLDGEPKLAHVAQAGHYLWQTGLDTYQLLYVQSVEYAAPFTMTKGKALETYAEHNHPKAHQIAYRSGKPFKLLPGRICYELKFDNQGVLCYREAAVRGATWTKTIITAEAIQDFYNYVDDQEQERQLAARPMTLKYDGSAGTFNMCDPKYCELAGICDTYERYFDKWVAEVQAYADNNKEV